MGLDQYLHSTSIPETFFIEASKNEDAFNLVVNGFYYEQDEYNRNRSYAYFRKDWPIDYLIKENSVWQYGEWDCCYYIPPENALKILDTCIRALRMFKPLHDLTDEEIINADYDNKILDEIVYHYPEGSENYCQVIKQLGYIINIDSMSFDLMWEVSSLIDIIKLISDERNKGNGLFYIRSY